MVTKAKSQKRTTQRTKNPTRKQTRNDVPPEPEIEWKPITSLGKLVKQGEISDIEEVFNEGYSIQEAEIVNILLPGLEEDLLLIGQAKGKFGGGQRRIFRQTQKKTREGNKIHFMTCALVGNRNGYLGVAVGKSKETVPARDKAKRKARLRLMRIKRGCGSWECNCREPHSIPFAVEGRCGSSRIKLIPAPKGKGLCVDKECAKILAMAGIKDVWSKTLGQTKTKLNLISALIEALQQLTKIKVKPEDITALGIVEGKLKSEENITNAAEIEADAEGTGAESDVSKGNEEDQTKEEVVEDDQQKSKSESSNGGEDREDTKNASKNG